MNESHLTDLDFENYVYEGIGQNKLHLEHIQSCLDCQAKLEGIQNLKLQLSLQNKPAFSFDLVALVMPQLDAVSREKNWFSIIVNALIAISILSTICLMIYFRDYFSGLTYNFGSNWISILLIPVVFYMVWGFKDLIQAYRNNLNQLKTS
ncbi:MAG: hypothetical protein ABI761_18175 [Saprospiraceae bacterium]